MVNRRTPVIMFGTIVVLGGAAWGATRYFGAADAPAAKAGPAALSAASELEQRNRTIAFFQERARDDPYSAADRAWLASLFLQRGRETGNNEDFRRAEELARESLALRIAHNTQTYRTLAVSLLDQHRFVEALEAARTLVEADPTEPSARALLGDVQMELGDYDAAHVTFGSLEGARNNPVVAPSLAHWAEVSGHTGEARNLLYAARDRVAAHPALSRGQMAWFHFRVGDFELRNGRLKEAEEAFRAGLATRPDDYRLLAAMARLEAARQNWTEAIEYGEAAIARVLDPATLGLISDAYAALGDSARAAEYAKVMEVSILNQEKAYHREWSIFLLDHDRQIPEVYARAAEEIRTRPDTYGYDLFAWALHKQGRNAEARRAMAGALRMGTQDATLFYHAGMIERALGQNDAAKEHLRRALEVNPRFHPTHPAVAEAVLDSIADEGSLFSRLPF